MLSRASSKSDEGGREGMLTGSESVIVILATMGFLGGCIGAVLQCALRSRCTTIKCCGAYIERDVVSDEQATTLDTGALEGVGK